RTICASDGAAAGAAGGTVLPPPPGGGASNALTLTSVPSLAVSVVRAGRGSGTVTSAPAGIDCGSVCSARFATGTSVVLTANPASTSTFAGWRGCDSVAGARCTVSVPATRTVTAPFEVVPVRLPVTKDG